MVMQFQNKKEIENMFIFLSWYFILRPSIIIIIIFFNL